MNLKKLYIIDPFMASKLGHNYEYNMTLLRLLRTEFDVRIFCERRFQRKNLEEKSALFPVFTNHMISNKSYSLFKSILNKLTVIKNLIKLTMNICGLNIDKRLCIQIVDAIKDIPKNSYLLFPTIPTRTFCNLIKMLEKNRMLDSYNYRFILLYDPSSLDIVLYNKARLLISLKNNIKLATDTNKLKDAYEWRFKREVIKLPYIFDFDLQVREKQQDSSTFVISYLGLATKSKGFCLLPHLVDYVLSENNKKTKVKFVIQTSYNEVDNDVKISIEKLKNLTRKYPNSITLLHAALSNKKFKEYLINSDLLLLLYDNNAYKKRSSGLLAQANFFGVTVVIPYQSSLNYLTSNPAILYNSALDLESCILNYINRHPLKKKKGTKSNECKKNALTQIRAFCLSEN